MTTQAYCMINPDNLCDNVCMWDGNPDTWQPPAGYTMLVQATTPDKVWGWDDVSKDWVLIDEIGYGGIGFTWDGTFLVTSEPKPSSQAAADQPTTSGTQTL